MRRWLDAQDGNVALIFALALPILLVVSLGALELTQVSTDKKKTQDVADAAALMGAGQLSVTPTGVAQRAQAFADSQLGQVKAHATVTITASSTTDTVTVAIATQRASFFGNLLPPGGFHTRVQATAKSANTAPLCVLTTGTAQGSSLPVLGAATSPDQLAIDLGGAMQAGECLVHSASAITALGLLQASVSEAVGSATGLITPAPLTSAPAIPDPFASVNIDMPAGSSCANAVDQKITGSGVTTLPAYTTGAALHGSITVGGDAVLNLAPGEHYFCGALTLSGNSQLTGTDVVMVLGPSASANFGLTNLVKHIIPGSNKVRVSLTGRQSGALAGFVIIADRQYTSTFLLDGDAISNLTGTVYAPTAPLVIQGSVLANTAAPWTVVAAKDLELTGGILTINSNYGVSNVPVPVGVGNRRSTSASALQQ